MKTITVVPTKCGCHIEGPIIKLCPMHKAAPELLEAAKKAAIVLSLETRHVDPTTGDAVSPLMKELRAAIHKAEGK